MIRRFLIAATLSVIGLHCSGMSPTAGGAGGETTNGICARIVYPDGTPVAGAVVRIRTADYLSDTSTGFGKKTSAILDLLTDESGRFIADYLDFVRYAIEAMDANGNAVLSFCTPDSTTDLGTLVLDSPGTIRGRVLGPGRAIVRIYGLERHVRSDAAGAFAVTVPAGYRLTVNVIAADSVIDTLLPTPIVPAQATILDVALGSYRSDSLAVRAFLDNMGLFTVTVASVTRTAPDGRISRLDLSNRGITSLHPLVGSLYFLYEINLSGNTLTGLPDTLASMPTLWHLLLKNNPLNAVPEVIPDIPNLKLLDLGGTGISVLPATLSRCVTLEVLSVANAAISQFPTVVATLPRLYGLNLKGNQLRSIPPEISTCPNLAELDLSGNMIDSLPEEFGSMSKLRVLYIYSNALKRLPGSMGSLSSMELLHLESNQLDSLPSGIGALNRIHTLELSFNNLSAIPESFTGLTPTTSLKVVENRLCAPSQALAGWLDRYSTPDWRTSQRGCP